MEMPSISAGDNCRVLTSKWGNKRHYEYDATFLGVDEYGAWLSAPQGTHFWRPDHEFHSGFPQVILLPNGKKPWYVHYFGKSDTGKPPRHYTYADISTPWNEASGTFSVVDLDLDVIGQVDGKIRIDDVEEFFSNRDDLQYPPDVAAVALETCLRIYSQMRTQQAPFDGAHLKWADRAGFAGHAPDSPATVEFS
ncbi:DUF402 domain-containing protein [Kribbella sp. NPDC051587]|uniref:DUF402 domain-containing protein n=1 Tax=Kribbella sp. NPDC051587 TaxID=3364119 RepID=UPI0037B85941